jgi:sugar phosphate isomerase/epimerase
MPTPSKRTYLPPSLAINVGNRCTRQIQQAMNPSAIILDYLTVAALTPQDLVSTASSCGYDGITLWVNAPVDTLELPLMKAGSEQLRQLKREIDARGLIVQGVEAFDLSAPVLRDQLLAALDAGVELGAASATVLCLAPTEPNLLIERLGALADDARERGLTLTIEPMARSLAAGFNAIDEALDAIIRIGASNIGLTIDALHMMRTHTTLEQLAAIPPERIAYIQLCDSPTEMPIEQQVHEAGFHRLYPGEGAFPLQ